jgi:hypothetical protein
MIFPEEQEPVVRTIEDLRAMLTRIEIGPPLAKMNWTFECATLAEHEGWLVWTTFDRPDANTGEIGRGRSRKEYVPPLASLSGVVRTCWLLVELTTRHEAMEAFLFNGARVFDPHRPIGTIARSEPREAIDDHLRRCGGLRGLPMALVEFAIFVVCPGCRTVLKDRYGKWPRPASSYEHVGFTVPRAFEREVSTLAAKEGCASWVLYV